VETKKAASPAGEKERSPSPQRPEKDATTGSLQEPPFSSEYTIVQCAKLGASFRK
jgi:hypothetical protein